MGAKKVLLVDDSETILMMHRLMLRECPYELVTAKDGKEAVEKAQAEQPDAIVMDVNMPEMTGFQACRAMRGIEPLQNTPIILVTTKNEMSEHATETAESGCTECLTKPVKKDELIGRLRHHLGA